MGLESARQSIVTAIEAAKTGNPVTGLIIEYDNRIIVDTQTQTNPYLAVMIMWMRGEQADLSATPLHRMYGQIHLAAVVKEGSGSAAANGLLDWFYPRLQRKSLGAVRTLMADLAPVKPFQGWQYFPVLIPFWYDITD